MSSGTMEMKRDPGAGTIVSVATALPAYTMTRDEVKRYMREVFALDERKLRALYAVVDNTRVEKRHSIFPLDYFIEPRPLEKITKEYREHAIQLGRQAACAALSAAGVRAADIDLFITVSCTGVMIPSLDAHLINEMGFRSNVRRLPITELGCAAGAAALGHAWHFLRGCPQGRVLVLAVELPTLTFQRNDLSQANLISCALFGDGAGAAVVTGEPQAGPRMVAADSYIFPHSLDAMGFDLRETGFHIILAREVPDLIRSRIKSLVEEFLERNNRRKEDIDAWVLHPGGQKLLSYVEQELGLDARQTQPSWDVLRDYGNLSSASVLFVLEQWLNKQKVSPGASGLLVGFGPGFSAEMVLLEWRN